MNFYVISYNGEYLTTSNEYSPDLLKAKSFNSLEVAREKCKQFSSNELIIYQCFESKKDDLELRGIISGPEFVFKVSD